MCLAWDSMDTKKTKFIKEVRDFTEYMNFDLFAVGDGKNDMRVCVNNEAMPKKTFPKVPFEGINNLCLCQANGSAGGNICQAGETCVDGKCKSARSLDDIILI